MILEWGSQGIIVLPILFKILTYGLHTHTHAHTHMHTHMHTHTCIHTHTHTHPPQTSASYLHSLHVLQVTPLTFGVHPSI